MRDRQTTLLQPPRRGLIRITCDNRCVTDVPRKTIALDMKCPKCGARVWNFPAIEALMATAYHWGQLRWQPGGDA